ncbi:MAG: hypothetical protein E4H13_08345 [Calditrichales bacterium]|nr:MAG: hypothetical protein E4H13_08345 [Calditrichales bacterium]
MTNRIVIDGWNVCWKMPEIEKLINENLEQARKQFIQIVKTHFQTKNATFKIIFDGQPNVFGGEEKSVSFSKNPQTADDKIIQFLKKQKGANSWTVVTSDRELASRAKNIGARTISSENFITKLSKYKSSTMNSGHKEKPRVKPEDISYWLDKFTD